MPRCLSPDKSPGLAFTVVELLVSCAILAMLVLALSSAFSGFANVASSSTKRMETRKDASSVFDRLTFDLASAVNTPGVTYDFIKNGGALGPTNTVNDAIAFLADAPSTNAAARLSVVGYDVRNSTNSARRTSHPTLTRHVQPFLWTDDISRIALEEVKTEQQPITPGVFRMELAFLTTSGDLKAEMPTTNGVGDSSQVKAVICAVASLDEDTLDKLSDSEKRTLQNALPDAIDGQTPLSRWQVDSVGGLPPPVIQNIHFRQRYYYLK